jgi:hypothetical protein
LETVTSPLETFSILKEKIFNPEYNTDINGTPDTITYIYTYLYITSLFHNDTYYLSGQAFWEPDAS